MSFIWDPALWDAAVQRTLLFMPRAAVAALVLLVFWLAAGAIERLIQRTALPGKSPATR